MTADDLAAIHRAAMRGSRPWTAAEFADLLAGPGAVLAACGRGFALGRVVLDEAELLALAVHPDAWRRGIGRRCLDGYHARARAAGAHLSHIEVAAGNSAARALYAAAGYVEIGRRPGYYGDSGTRDDALLLCLRWDP